MGSTKLMLTKLIQDSVLKLCTQNLTFSSTLEIDGIICINTGPQDDEIVVKMHRTIVNQQNDRTPLLDQWENTELPMPRTQYSEHFSKEKQQFQKPYLSPQTHAPVKSTPAKITETAVRMPTLSSSTYSPGPPSATLHAPGGKLPYDSQDIVKAEPPGNDKQILGKRPVLDTKETTLKPIPEKHIKIEKDEPITIEIGEDEEEFGGAEDQESYTTGNSWMGDDMYEQDISMNTSMNDMAASKQVPGGILDSKKGGIYPVQRWTEEKKHICPLCHKGFSRNYDLKRHSRIHTGEKPYQCEICSKTFSRKCSLQKHSRVHLNDGSTHFEEYSSENNNTAMNNTEYLMEPYLQQNTSMEIPLKIELESSHLDDSVETDVVKKEIDDTM